VSFLSEIFSRTETAVAFGL